MNELEIQGCIMDERDIEEIENLFFGFLGDNNLFFGGGLGYNENIETQHAYALGMSKALEIVTNEIEYAVQINPHMALGMEQVKRLIQNEINRLKNS